MLGLDDARKFSNITFKNCYYNGKWLGSFEDGNFLVNKYVENIFFILDSVKHKITLSVNNQAGGTVTGDGNYTHGINATVVANPANGYIFSGWMVGSITASENPHYTFTVVKDLDLKAIFGFPTNIAEKLEMPFSIYPNPATDKLFINSANKTINKIQLIDLTGKVVYTKNAASLYETINISRYISGLYLVQVHTAEKVFTTKIAINRN